MTRLPVGVLVWHPFLFATWPVIGLYENNVGNVPVRELAWGVLIAVAVAGVLFAGAFAAVRDATVAALQTSVLTLAILLWGVARDATGEASWLLPVWLAGAVALVAALVAARPIARELSVIATGMAVVAFTLVAVPTLRNVEVTVGESASAAPDAEDLDRLIGQWDADGEPRDIYYLVFDRYGSQASMERRWAADFSDFFDGLADRGFRVTPDSKANHLRTAQSLSSTFNLRYHHDLARRYGPDTGNMLPVYELLQEHAVGRLLQDRGYTYVHIGNWWDPTQHNRMADFSWSYERWSDFQLELFRSSLLEVFENRPKGRSLVEQRRRMPYDGAIAQFEQIRRAAQRPGPTFTFAHILLPHEPFVFDRHGNYVDYDEEARRGRRRNYVEQTEYTNGRIEALLDDLLDTDPDEQPIIVLSADEGPHPVRFKQDEENFDWTKATDDELEEKMAILNAYFLPDVDDPGLYDGISPVNTWRVIFNAYFGADLPLLEDRSYVFRNEHHVYDFTDVTERLRRP